MRLNVNFQIQDLVALINYRSTRLVGGDREDRTAKQFSIPVNQAKMGKIGGGQLAVVGDRSEKGFKF
ncbi:hypothetical protein RRH01S_12_00940 [Rhizobium rhizogenes NBRC 13257]|uniref:Uncharacterized protein n=1 Tax=Rhizobium rhizogenes NBRC 13257 TaxID=1220581 RepID=A0AA87Q7G0_RHIRH|nr:hypothetical protein RRH01S_12_00940 [Rhizobium rhizogenes NBRC 13257]